VKPWPTEIQKRYPTHNGYHGSVAERPWWRGNLKPGGMLFRQPGEDGVNVEWQKEYAYVRFPINASGHRFNVAYSAHPQRGSISEFGEAAVADFGENYDATMPMGTEADVLALLERLDRERPLPHPGFRVGQIWARDDGSARIVQAFIEGEPLILAAAIDANGLTVRPLPPEFCYLVADPACPHLAPWSPS
jgi:hypothetical protein